MASLRHVIWDWNGTLFDDAWLCLEAINELLLREKLPLLSAARYRRIFDFPVKNYYEAAGFDFTRKSFEELGAEFMEIYEERRFECDLQAGARETLMAIAEAGASQSILSAYRGKNLREVVDHFELLDFFQDTRGADDIYAHGKVEVGRAVIASLGIPPEEVVMVGDTTHDAEVARAMGVTVLLVDGGHQDRPRLEALGEALVDDAPAVGRWLLDRI